MTEKIVCKLCIMRKGLKGSDLWRGKCNYAFDTEKEFVEHMEKKHGIKVKRNE